MSGRGRLLRGPVALSTALADPVRLDCFALGVKNRMAWAPCAAPDRPQPRSCRPRLSRQSPQNATPTVVILTMAASLTAPGTGCSGPAPKPCLWSHFATSKPPTPPRMKTGGRARFALADTAFCGFKLSLADVVAICDHIRFPPVPSVTMTIMRPPSAQRSRTASRRRRARPLRRSASARTGRRRP